MSSKSGNTHEKSKKNSKKNKGGSYKFKIAAKYKKPKTRGDKTFNKKNKIIYFIIDSKSKIKA